MTNPRHHPSEDLLAAHAAGTLEHGGALCGQTAQMDTARLVRAVLRPHDGEDPQLGEAERPQGGVQPHASLRVHLGKVGPERAVVGVEPGAHRVVFALGILELRRCQLRPENGKQ